MTAIIQRGNPFLRWRMSSQYNNGSPQFFFYDAEQEVITVKLSGLQLRKKEVKINNPKTNQSRFFLESGTFDDSYHFLALERMALWVIPQRKKYDEMRDEPERIFREAVGVRNVPEQELKR